MRLTQVLQFYTRYRRVPGLLRYGKNRVITPISISAKRKAAELMVFEKENVDILNKPYLSVAEEAAYNSVVEKVPFITEAERKKLRYWWEREELPPNLTTEELLQDLSFSRKWE